MGVSNTNCEITKQVDGRYNSDTCAASIRGKIVILRNIQKAADTIIDARGITQGIEIGAIWTRKGETSGKD